VPSRNIPEVSNIAEPEPAFFFQFPPHSLQEKFYCKPMVPMESVYSKGVAFRGHNPPDDNNPKRGSGTPNSKNNFRFQKFIYNFILFHQLNGSIKNAKSTLINRTQQQQQRKKKKKKTRT